MAIFTHVTVGTNDPAKARAFYDVVFAPLGHVAVLAQGGKDEGAVGPRSFWPHA